MASTRKRPALLWYTGDWLKDPHLSMCSPATRGIWMDVLCMMHENGESGTITGTVVGLARACRCSPEELESALSELEVSGTCPPIVRSNSGGSHENVTLVNRRMVREAEIRKSGRNRKMQERDRKRSGRSRDCHENVTPPLSVTSSSSPSSTPPNPPEGGSLFGEDDPNKIDWQAIIVRWNDLAKANGRPKVYSLNDARKKKYRARLKANPDFWEILERELPLLNEHARAAKNYCTFPWLIQSQENLDKLAEKNYREEKDGPEKPAKGEAGVGGRTVNRDEFYPWMQAQAQERAKGEPDGPEAKEEKNPREGERENRATGGPSAGES